MPVTTWSVHRLEGSDLSHGTAINSTMRQVMGAIGSAIMTTILSLFSARSGLADPAAAGIVGTNASMLFSGVVCVACLLLAIFFIRDGKRVRVS